MSKNGHELVTLVVGMDEENNLIQSETVTYPLSEMFADIGGAGGLFLGLSVVGRRSKIIFTQSGPHVRARCQNAWNNFRSKKAFLKSSFVPWTY